MNARRAAFLGLGLALALLACNPPSTLPDGGTMRPDGLDVPSPAWQEQIVYFVVTDRQIFGSAWPDVQLGSQPRGNSKHAVVRINRDHGAGRAYPPQRRSRDHAGPGTDIE